MGVGRKRRAGENVNRDTNNRHHAGVFKTSLFRELDTASADPNADLNTLQPAPFPAARPRLGTWPRAPGPGPQGSGERGEGGARGVLAV